MIKIPQDLLDAACEAEEQFSLDELEAYAQRRQLVDRMHQLKGMLDNCEWAPEDRQDLIREFQEVRRKLSLPTD